MKKEPMDDLTIDVLAASPLSNIFILSKIGTAAMYEQLAEECAELSKACLKKARIIRGNNPTPVTYEEADSAIIEEFTDVIHVSNILGLDQQKNFEQIHRKQKRWIKRILETSQEIHMI